MTKLEWNDLVNQMEKFLLKDVPEDIKMTVGLMVDSRIETLAQDVNTISMAYQRGLNERADQIDGCLKSIDKTKIT